MRGRGWRRRCSCHCYETSRRSVCFDKLVDVPSRRAVDARQRIRHRRVDVEEADSPLEERLHRRLVRRVERAGERAAALPGLPGEREQRKRLQGRLVELEAKAAGEVELLE